MAIKNTLNLGLSKMRKFLLNKLVRDNIYDDMVKAGQQVNSKVLNKEAFLKALKAKLLEEAKEFDPNAKNAVDELADLLEVITYVAATLGYTSDQLRKIQKDRHEKRGGFEKRVYVASLELADDDPWVDYYAKDPTRFPEVE